MFMIPMPPTSKEMLAMPPRRMGEVRDQGEDGEEVLLGSTLKSSPGRGRSLAWPDLLRRPVHGACAPGLGDYLPHVPAPESVRASSVIMYEVSGTGGPNAGFTTSSTPTTS